MANNRMYLVHRPTGRSILLGKRYALGWGVGTSIDAAALAAFFQDVATGPQREQDDFMLVMEDNQGAPMAGTYLVVNEDGKPADFRAPLPERHTSQAVFLAPRVEDAQ